MTKLKYLLPRVILALALACAPALAKADDATTQTLFTNVNIFDGVVTLSLLDWNLPTTADFDAWDFSGLARRSVVHIGPNSLNVTMPFG